MEAVPNFDILACHFLPREFLESAQTAEVVRCRCSPGPHATAAPYCQSVTGLAACSDKRARSELQAQGLSWPSLCLLLQGPTSITALVHVHVQLCPHPLGNWVFS